MKTIEGFYFDGTSAKKNPIICDIFSNRMVPQNSCLGLGTLELNKLKCKKINQYVSFKHQKNLFYFPLSDWEGKIAPIRSHWPLNLKRAIIYFLAILTLVPLLLNGIKKSSALIALLIPEEVEQSLGQNVIQSFPSGTCQKPKSIKSLQKMIRPFLDKDQKVTITLLKNDMVNAFAAPGNNIIVTTGLLKFVNSENELLGVLLHELGHVYHNHPTKMIFEDMTYSFLLNLILEGKGQTFEGEKTSLSVLIYLKKRMLIKKHFNCAHSIVENS